MKVKKQQIIDGIVKFIRNDIVEEVTNSNFKVILHAAAAAIETNTKMLDSVFENPIVKMALIEDEGSYDITQAEKILSNTLESSGGFTIEVPAIKFILPQSQELTFGADDVHKISAYIRGDK